MQDSTNGQNAMKATLLEVIRPRFFPGQSLSNQDLEAILAWTGQRLRLEPHCGWGVVCGLHVTADLEDGSKVRVSPGYGFDRNQELCVVSKACTYELPVCGSSIACEGDVEPAVTLPGGQYPASQLQVYDLYLFPGLCDDHRTVGRSDTGDRVCQVSRQRISAKLNVLRVPQAVLNNPDAQSDRETPASKFVKAFTDQFPTLRPELLQAIEDWLWKQVRQTPEMLVVPATMLSQTAFGSDFSGLVELLDWLSFGLRRQTACDCPAAHPEIPLARIWTRCNTGKREVLWVNDRHPYRKMSACEPGFHWQQWLGAPLAAARAAATACGVTLTEVEYQHPENSQQLLDDVKAEAKLPQIVSPGRTLLANIRTLETALSPMVWQFSEPEGAQPTAAVPVAPAEAEPGDGDDH